jgi:hypothetical protein
VVPASHCRGFVWLSCGGRSTFARDILVQISAVTDDAETVSCAKRRRYNSRGSGIDTEEIPRSSCGRPVNPPRPHVDVGSHDTSDFSNSVSPNPQVESLLLGRPAADLQGLIVHREPYLVKSEARKCSSGLSKTCSHTMIFPCEEEVRQPVKRVSLKALGPLASSLTFVSRNLDSHRIEGGRGRQGLGF